MLKKCTIDPIQTASKRAIQKIINLFELSKFRTKYWIEINGQSRGVYNTDSDIRFTATMLKSSLCNYRDAYILLKGRITITGAGDDVAARQANKRDKGVYLKTVLHLLIVKVK